MELLESVDREWAALVTFLPGDLDASSFESGALVRRREVRSASELMRLAMAYSVGGRSLRETVAWAHEAGVAHLSDVALLKRLKASSKWLGGVLGCMLAERCRDLSARCPGLRVRLLDATTVSRQGSKGMDWRIHLGFDLGTLLIDHVELTDAKGGETFLRHPVRAGELIIADGGYAHRRGIHRVASCGGHVLVRLNWQNVPLVDADAKPLDIVAALTSVPIGGTLDLAVQTAADEKSGTPSVAGRLVAVRKSQAAAERARRHVIQQARKKGRTLDERTLISADFIFVFTTLPAEQVSGADVLELYRFRWQIELAFKRLKGILNLDQMTAQDAELCKTFLFSKIIAALLVEKLARSGVGFSPWDTVDQYPPSMWRLYRMVLETIHSVITGRCSIIRILAAAPLSSRALLDSPRRRPKQSLRAKTYALQLQCLPVLS